MEVDIDSVGDRRSRAFVVPARDMVLRLSLLKWREFQPYPMGALGIGNCGRDPLECLNFLPVVIGEVSFIPHDGRLGLVRVIPKVSLI